MTQTGIEKKTRGYRKRRYSQAVLHIKEHGTFVLDGRKVSHRRLMRAKLPDGV